MVYNFFDKKTSGGAIENQITSNKDLNEELYKPIIRTFKKWKVYSPLFRQYLGCWSCQFVINKQF